MRYLFIYLFLYYFVRMVRGHQNQTVNNSDFLIKESDSIEQDTVQLSADIKCNSTGRKANDSQRGNKCTSIGVCNETNVMHYFYLQFIQSPHLYMFRSR
jgi:hypothetical protein